MKKSITLLALALVAFTNVALASHSGSKANHYLTSASCLHNGSDVNLSKFVRVKSVDANSISTAVENLKYTKSIDEVIAQDLKVTESKATLAGNAPDVSHLKYTKTVRDVIDDNLKITESIF